MTVFVFFFSCSYVAPEYASTGMLTERSDVYSFGVLIMEIITGRSPVDYGRPPGEVVIISPIIIIIIVYYLTLQLFMKLNIAGNG